MGVILRFDNCYSIMRCVQMLNNVFVLFVQTYKYRHKLKGRTLFYVEKLRYISFRLIDFGETLQFMSQGSILIYKVPVQIY